MKKINPIFVLSSLILFSLFGLCNAVNEKKTPNEREKTKEEVIESIFNLLY